MKPALRVACLQFARHLFKEPGPGGKSPLLPRAWQMGEIACANAFHACTQRGLRSVNAPSARPAGQRTKQHGLPPAIHTACTSWFQVSLRPRAQVANQSTAPGAWRLPSNWSPGDRGHCRQATSCARSSVKLTLRAANLAHGVFVTGYVRSRCGLQNGWRNDFAVGPPGRPGQQQVQAQLAQTMPTVPLPSLRRRTVSKCPLGFQQFRVRRVVGNRCRSWA